MYMGSMDILRLWLQLLGGISQRVWLNSSELFLLRDRRISIVFQLVLVCKAEYAQCRLRISRAVQGFAVIDDCTGHGIVLAEVCSIFRLAFAILDIVAPVRCYILVAIGIGCLRSYIPRSSRSYFGDQIGFFTIRLLVFVGVMRPFGFFCPPFLL